MKRPKRSAESKPGGIFQTGSSSTVSKGTELSFFLWALGGVGSTSQSSTVQDEDKSLHAKRGANNVHSAGSSRSLTRTFKRCNRVKGASAKRAKEGSGRWIQNHGSHRLASSDKITTRVCKLLVSRPWSFNVHTAQPETTRRRRPT